MKKKWIIPIIVLEALLTVFLSYTGLDYDADTEAARGTGHGFLPGEEQQAETVEFILENLDR